MSETLSVKEWRDHEIWVTGRSESLKMAPFDTSYTTCKTFLSYLTLNSIVTLEVFLYFCINFIFLHIT